MDDKLTSKQALDELRNEIRKQHGTKADVLLAYFDARATKLFNDHHNEGMPGDVYLAYLCLSIGAKFEEM